MSRSTRKPGRRTRSKIILYASGSIIYQYQSIANTTTSEGIGIQNADGTVGMNVFCDGAGTFTPDAETAIMIAQPTGFPGPCSDFTTTVDGHTVTLNWTMPTVDTQGNPIEVDSVAVYLSGSQLVMVTGGANSWVHENAPDGSLLYTIYPINEGWMGPGVSQTAIVGTPSYLSDFEADDGMWVATPTDTGLGWQCGKPTNPSGPGAAHGGTRCWGIGLTQDYVLYKCANMQLNLGQVVSSDAASAEFWFYCNTEPTYDGVNFQASVDGGETWQILTPSEFRL